MTSSQISHALESCPRTVRTIYEWLVAQHLQPGDCLPTETALAQAMDRSQPTVHRALRTLVDRGLISQVGRTRIMAGAPVRTSGTPMAAMLIGPGTSDFVLADPQQRGGHQDAIGLAIQQRLQRSGHPLTIVPPANALAALAGLGSAAYAAAFIQAADMPSTLTDALLAWADAQRLRCILYVAGEEHATRDRVCSDQAEGGAALVHLLAARGRRIMLPIQGAEASMPSWMQRRIQGMHAAADALGLPQLKPMAVRLAPTTEPPQVAFPANTQAFLTVIRTLAANPNIDAFLVPSDGHVPALAAALRQAGRHPGRDCDIVGFDHYFHTMTEARFDAYRPPASVDKDNAAIGAAMAELFLELIADPTLPSARLRRVPMRLVRYDA